MQDESTEARSSDLEPAATDQNSHSVTVTDAVTEAPSSSSAVAPSTNQNSDEIANGYRYGCDNV